MDVRPIDNPGLVWDRMRSQMADQYPAHETDPGGSYFGVFDGDIMAGAFSIRPWNTHCFEIHGGVAPEYWGRGHEVCWHLGNGLFEHTACLKIVCPVPECNHLMRMCLAKCGLREEGRLTKAFMKHSKLHDILIYAIKKRERGPLCQQQQQRERRRLSHG